MSAPIRASISRDGSVLIPANAETPSEREIAKHDAADELAENGRLTCAHREIAAELCGHEDDRQPEGDCRDRIVVRCLRLRPRWARG